MLPLTIGVALALAVCAYSAALRMDRDGALYPVMLIVVASYYVLFATMGADGRTIAVEIAIAAAFVIAATLGFRRTQWITAIALAAHGALDAVHGRLVANPGVPAWWPPFCAAFDVAAAAWLAWTLARRAPLGTQATRAHGVR